jgi:polyhydroxyalkanoate synthesis regulator phasin
MIPTRWQTIASDEDHYQRQLLDEMVKAGKIKQAEATARLKERDQVREQYKRVTV